jgi:hypothetical protein
LQRPVHHLALRWIKVKTIVGTLALVKASQSLISLGKENKTKQTLRLSTKLSTKLSTQLSFWLVIKAIQALRLSCYLFE